MLISRKATNWEIVVPSKLNLFLEVLGKRSDGYHDLDTMMLAIDLCDRLRIKASESQELQFRVTSASGNEFQKLSNADNAWEIPSDGNNLVVRALEAVRQKYDIRNGLDIELIKGIPSQAGLGGGSSDAAGAIVGGMLAWLGEYRATEAAELASGLGSDINFFIEGRSSDAGQGNWLARCTGRGECVSPIPSNWAIDFVVVHPPMGCSTQGIFRRLAESNSIGSGRMSVDAMFHAMENRDRSTMAKNLFNRLGDFAAAENPWICRAREFLTDDPSVMGICVSGSGSAVFAVVESAEPAKALADHLTKRYPVRAYAVRNWQTPSIGEQLLAMNSR